MNTNENPLKVRHVGAVATKIHNKKNSYLFQLLFSFIFLNFLSACGDGSNSVSTNATTTKLPIELQKLEIPSEGELIAYIVIDGNDANRIPMTINPQGEGSATVVIPNLSRAVHIVLTTYAYRDAGGTIILATKRSRVDLTGGSDSLNIDANEYQTTGAAFDIDNDGISNAEELRFGTDPRNNIIGGDSLVNLGINTSLPDLVQSAINATSGSLRALITVDGIAEQQLLDFDPSDGSLSTFITGLSRSTHRIIITLEYTYAGGTLILARLTDEFNLTVGGQNINIDKANFEFAAFDEDNDGSTNVGELVVGSDPFNLNSPRVASTLKLDLKAIKNFQFSWLDVPDASYYRLMESIDTGSIFSQVGDRISPGAQVFNHIIPLFAHLNASYKLQSCNKQGCVETPQFIDVTGSLIESIGYLKANENISNLNFGVNVSLSDDGTVLAVGAPAEDITASTDVFGVSAGVVYVFTFDGNQWTQQARLKAENADDDDLFGMEVSLSGDGSTLAVSAGHEDSDTKGVNTVANNLAIDSGAVYIFTRNNGNWSQQAYLKASNAETDDSFGIGIIGNGLLVSSSISLSTNGNTLAIGAYGEDSDAKGLDGDQNNNLAEQSGAVYIFSRKNNLWSQVAYLKSSNAEAGDFFGVSVSINGDGTVLAVGARGEDSVGTGVDSGLQLDNSLAAAGAVYMFNFLNGWKQEAYIKPDILTSADDFGGALSLSADGLTLAVSGNDNNSNTGNSVYVFSHENLWVQQTTIKPSNTAADITFGDSISLSKDGNTLAVSDKYEKSGLTGFNADQSTITRTVGSGGAYTYVRRNKIWSQQSHIKAINPDNDDFFGNGLSISGDGSVLVVGAPFEDSDGVGINPVSQDGGSAASGAVYLY